jgi:hypothetical protein
MASLWLVLALGGVGCGGDDAASDGGSDATVDAFDLCDAFTEVGAACPFASPLRCFPTCEAGGCFCRATSGGPQWTCQVDVSCLPDCAPLDDGCASGNPGDDGGADTGDDGGEGGDASSD